jgi:excisionase family DNA binding protein
METVSIPADVYNDLLSKVDNIFNRLENPAEKYPLNERWLDIQETCQLLKISKRTLQAYRDNGILSFSQIGGKIYFKVADIEEHLKKHYVRAFSSKKNKRYERNDI